MRRYKGFLFVVLISKTPHAAWTRMWSYMFTAQNNIHGTILRWQRHGSWNNLFLSFVDLTNPSFHLETLKSCSSISFYRMEHFWWITKTAQLKSGVTTNPVPSQLTWRLHTLQKLWKLHLAHSVWVGNQWPEDHVLSRVRESELGTELGVHDTYGPIHVKTFQMLSCEWIPNYNSVSHHLIHAMNITLIFFFFSVFEI